MVEIRLLTLEDDCKDLVILSRAFFHEYESHHEDFFKLDRLEESDITSYFSSFCRTDSRKAYIAVDGNRMVGYITVYVKDQTSYWQVKQVGEISGLMLQEEYRHQGLARRLLQESIKFFKAHGLSYYTVYTAVENQVAIDFYQENGLVPLYTTMIGEV